jgi:hypothetical protein
MNVSNKLECVSGKFFQPSLLLAGKGHNPPKWSHSNELHSKVGSWPFPQPLD